MTAIILLSLAACAACNVVVLLRAMRHAETRPCPVIVPRMVGPQRSRVPVVLARGQIVDVRA